MVTFLVAVFTGKPKELEVGWPESIFHSTRPESVHFFQLCISLSTLCMPLRASLCACPACASMRFSVRSARASTQFTVYFPCACIYALALRVPLCVSLSTSQHGVTPHGTTHSLGTSLTAQQPDLTPQANPTGTPQHVYVATALSGAFVCVCVFHISLYLSELGCELQNAQIVSTKAWYTTLHRHALQFFVHSHLYTFLATTFQ